MSDSLESRPVMVAVANPDHVEQLVRTAGDLARLVDGHVQIVSIVAKPYGSPFSVYSDETIIERYARNTQDVLDAATAVAPSDVPIDREIIVGRSVADGVLTAITRANARSLVIGWQSERSRTDALFGSNLDRLIKQAACDLYVERIGDEANGVESILLPVAGGPHVRPAAVAAKAIAARNDATVHLLSVVESNGDASAAREYVESAKLLIEEAPGPDVTVEEEIGEDESITAMIVETATEHDVLIFGVTRRGSLRRRLLGSIPQTVLPRTDSTVLLARSADVVDTPRFGHLRRLWGRS